MIDYNFSKKLKDVDVAECSARHEDGETYASLGRVFGCDPETVSRAVKKYNESYASQVAAFSGNDPEYLDCQCHTDSQDTYSPDYHYEEDLYDDSEGVDQSSDLVTVYNFVLTSESISITKAINDSEGFAVSTISEVVDKDHSKFKSIFDKIMKSLGSQEVLAEVFSEISVKERLEKIYNGQVLIDPARGTAVIQRDGKKPFTLPLSLSNQIAKAVNQDDKYVLDSLCNFAERLQHNPSYRAVQELYGFLKTTCIEIDKDGYVICFKKVRSNYMDIHSNTMLNAPGTEVRVERNQVDENSEQTCSHGLHVCSSSYLPSFGNGSDNRVVRVKVDPADFVAIPKDYNNAKARTCGYFVLDDVTGRF